MAKRRKKTEIEQVIELVRQSKDYEDQLVFAKTYPARKPRHAPLHPPISGPIAANLKKIGIKSLYSHQAEAVSVVREGGNVVLATDTASGKSLCYNIPVLETVIADENARALYIFPTKALGQDQTRMLHELVRPGADYDEKRCLHKLVCYDADYDENHCVDTPLVESRTVRFGTYDGDTPRDERAALRRDAQILLTNPDMLSMGILPNHNRYWARFFERLRYVVLDEIHTYRGVFGSHLANVMRRLLRICEYYGSKPQFICCSATIGNPGEHAGRLTGRQCAQITESGAPNAGRLFILWNPPLLPGAVDERRSPITETINLFSYLVQSNMRTIVFARAKPTVEVILKLTRDKLHKGPVSPERIVSYRGGYLPSERREIERDLAEGELLGVTCTSALELGVDIGSLDAAVINGYPGSIASMWQQAGRAGRRERQALAVFVAYHEPLDQYFMRHPEYFFGRPVEHAIVHPSNPYILELHLRAAAAELPLKRAEEPLFGENYIKTVRRLIKKGDLLEYRDGAKYVGDDYPASDINLRTTASRRYSIKLDDGTLIGEMDAANAFYYLHEGAVYLHQGETYFVENLDLKEKTATVRRKQMKYYTRALSREHIKVDEVTQKKKMGKIEVNFGYLEVKTRVHSYKKVRQRDNTVIGWQDLDFPEDRLWTQGFWFAPPEKAERKARKGELDLLGGLHAIEHASLAMLPLLAMCDRQDVGGVSTDSHPDVDNRPAIFIHDAYDGGMGLAEAGFDRFGDLMKKTLELIDGCGCEDGCPSCIQSPKCGNLNNPLDKKAAVMILKEIIIEISSV